ncbi:MAG: hypothetical protein PHI27_00525 [Eubacteriales bacterium]|nr:hypothetical protein [Eubacteriales bacterium]MDD3880718.1 hypothetical protein [Eubacteriales bacterium]MDD4511648.1 hypothetical protein [Eubacteriales bacterium]
MDKDKREIARRRREERLSFRAKGRSFFMTGSVLLLAWSGYELGVRMESIIPFTKTLYNIVIGESIPLSRALTYVDSGVYDVLETLLFLACCFMLGVFCLSLRNRPAASFALLPASAALMVYASGMTDPLQLNLWQFLKLIPLIMIALGAVTNIIHFCLIRRSHGHGGVHPEGHRGRENGRLDAPAREMDACGAKPEARYAETRGENR